MNPASPCRTFLRPVKSSGRVRPGVVSCIWAWSPPTFAWISGSCRGATRPLISELHCSSRKFTNLPHWPVRTRCGSDRRELHRSRPRQCDTSCQSALALQLARVSPDLRRLPSLPRLCHRLPSQNPSMRLETHLVRLDAAGLLSAMDAGPRLCPDLRDRKRDGPSLAVAGSTPKLPRLNLQATRSVPGAEGNVFFAVIGPIQVPKQLTAAIVDIIEQKHSQKENRFPLPHNMSGPSPHGDKPLELIQPLVTRAEAWQAIPGVSDCIIGIIKRGYSLQFARRPPRFSGVVPTLD